MNPTEIVTEAKPVDTVVAPVTEVKPVEESLTSKISKFKQQIAQNPPVVSTDSVMLDQKMIDAITDPKTKEAAQNFYKSVQGDYTKKTQTIAEQRKEFETKLEQMKTWSPERIQNELLTNPQFLQAAQLVAGTNSNRNPSNSGLSDEEFSALTDREKAEITALKTTVNSLQQANYQAVVSQTDAQLQVKYGNDYNPSVVNDGLVKLSNMQPHELREYVHKALSHDKDVEAAYQLGKQEAVQLNQNRMNTITLNGNQVVSNDGVPTRQQGERGEDFFQRIAQFRLAQSRKK